MINLSAGDGLTECPGPKRGRQKLRTTSDGELGEKDAIKECKSPPKMTDELLNYLERGRALWTVLYFYCFFIVYPFFTLYINAFASTRDSARIDRYPL